MTYIEQLKESKANKLDGNYKAIVLSDMHEC